MTSSKLILTQKTSVDEVNIFFKSDDLTKKVRARDLGNGQTELYVRKDSFKQFFTDKLRPDFLVKRDYLKAKNHILDIVKKSDPDGENSSAFLTIKKGMEYHKHDFYANNFSVYLNDAIYRKEEFTPLKEILEVDKSKANSLSAIGKIVNSKDIQEEITKVMNAIKDESDKDIFERNFTALLAVMQRQGPGYSAEPTVIDYKCAIDFFRVWLKEVKETGQDIKNSNNNKPDNEASTAKRQLTELAERVTRRGVPAQINLNGGKIENSEADLVIFDSHINISLSKLENNEKIESLQENDESGFSPYELSLYKNMATETDTRSKTDTAGLGITYNHGLTKKPVDIDLLYKELGKVIDEKIKLTPASNSSNPTSISGPSNQSFTIHLPILNPFEKKDLTMQQKKLIVDAFVKNTQKWLEKYPDLRIKVQPPENIEQSMIESVYRKNKNLQ